MGESSLILGVSGLRGIVGESLTPEVAVRYAGAIGRWLSRRFEATGPVVVGWDGRAGGRVFYECAIAGALGVGLDVQPIGIAMTPTAGVAVDSMGGVGAIIITASHNPQAWNGLKSLVFLHDEDQDDGVTARAPGTIEAEEIISEFHSGPDWSSAKHLGRLWPEHDALDEHLRRVSIGGLKLKNDQWHRHRVVLDSVNSSGAEGAMRLLRTGQLVLAQYRHDVVQLHGDGSGVFPHAPEPTAENLSGAGGLCDAVAGLKADVGFAQDPDGDRLAIVDERGVYIGEEYTLAIAAEAVLGVPGGGAKGAVLVTNLSTSRMVEDVAAAYGARVERTAVGEANVVERMKALKAAGENCVLGGEGNGGVIWPEVTYVRDSLSAMALTLGLMAREGRTVSQLVEKINGYARGGGYAIVKRKQPLASKADAAPAVGRIAERYAGERVDTQDGVRVDFDSGDRAGAWVHVRASNTEPILRLIAEAPSEGAAGSLLDEVAGVVGT